MYSKVKSIKVKQWPLPRNKAYIPERATARDIVTNKPSEK